MSGIWLSKGKSRIPGMQLDRDRLNLKATSTATLTKRTDVILTIFDLVRHRSKGNQS